jgi:hypothetical protein
MLYRNIFKPSILCFALLGCFHAVAEEETLPLSLPPAFGVSVYKGEIVGSEQIQRVMITSGTNEFLLISPPYMNVDATKANKIAFHPTDEKFHLIVRMSQSSPVSYAQLIENQYPGAKILGESSEVVDGRNIPVFDVLWKISGVPERTVRVAFVSTPAGLLEFNQISETGKTAEAQEAFTGLLNGFRSNRKGKIQIVAFPNCS